MSLVPPEWIEALAAILQEGLRDGRQPGDWLEHCRENPELYHDALMRHHSAARKQDTGWINQVDHLAAVACNALILRKTLLENHGYPVEREPSLAEALKGTTTVEVEEPLKRKGETKKCSTCGTTWLTGKDAPCPKCFPKIEPGEGAFKQVPGGYIKTPEGEDSWACQTPGCEVRLSNPEPYCYVCKHHRAGLRVPVCQAKGCENPRMPDKTYCPSCDRT